MEFIERQATRFLLTLRLSELHGEEFERFFHNLMCARYDDFLDVRTHGNIGDVGSDGISLHNRKLYACYAPQVFSVSNLNGKIRDDLRKAKEKRKAEFDTFVFVHNDPRGMRPEVSQTLGELSRENPDMLFEQFGFRKFSDEINKLERWAVEDLFGCPLPAREVAYGLAADDVIPLLDHLRTLRKKPTGQDSLDAVSALKLDYNRFSEEVHEELLGVMHLGRDIDDYYTQRSDVVERDEVAAGFRSEYLQVRQETSDPDTILWYLEQYILGNASVPIPKRKAAIAILAYFFQTCDIFEDAPDGLDGRVPNQELN